MVSTNGGNMKEREQFEWVQRQRLRCYRAPRTGFCAHCLVLNSSLECALLGMLAR